MSGSNAPTSPPPGADPAGWPRQAPPWLRRGVVFVLVAVAGFQASLWLYDNLRGFLGLLFLAWSRTDSIWTKVDTTRIPGHPSPRPPC